MKTLKFFILGTAVLSLFSCSQTPEEEQMNASVDFAAKKPVLFADYVLDKSQSKVNWEGNASGNHHGTMEITRSEFGIHNGKLVGGFFEIDLNSIACLGSENENLNKKLANQLKSEEFFNVAEFPTAKFKITEVEPISGENSGKTEEGGITPTHYITGNLTINGTTKTITLPAMVEMTDNSIITKTNRIVLDKMEWGIKNKSENNTSSSANNILKDDMAIAIELKVDRV